MSNEYKGPGTGLVDTFTPDNLLAGDFPIVTKDVVILEGQNLVRGAVLGRDGDGKWLLSLAAAVDDSEVPRGILVQSVDATAADKAGTVYLTGEFNERALTIGTGHTVASIEDGLREKGIFIKPSVKAAF